MHVDIRPNRARTIAAVHLRRALLLMAVVLFAVAIVQALAPAPRERSVSGGPAAVPGPVVAEPVRTLKLRYPAPRTPPRLRVTSGAHVVLQVSTSAPGQVSVPVLGLVQAAEPATPARFDVLAAREGTYTVTFEPSAGGTATLGRLVVGGR
jgi:hypothetical protein